MNDTELETVEQVRRFLEGNGVVEFRGLTVKEKYQWLQEVLIRFGYHLLGRDEKGVIRRYAAKVTGYSRAQVSRLIAEHRRTGRLKRTDYVRHRFPRRYTPSEIELLAATDELHGWLSGPATKKIMERECKVYGHIEFGNISRISVAHLYNLRRSNTYRNTTRRFVKTKPSVSRIGQRAKPDPKGQPGYIRIDTVHQGDTEGV
ncbi:MAG: integrase, partial [Bradymonadaceae bacterium]